MSQAPHNDKPGTTSHLYIEDVGQYKWAWVKAAKLAGMPLATWAIQTLNEAAKAQSQDPKNNAPAGT